MAAMNRLMLWAGVITLIQAGGQMLLTSLGLLQYFCVIDFLVELPLLVFIRILYFHNPGPCGIRVNIGQSIDSMADQAFVLLTTEPMTVTRTFIINTIALGLSVLWLFTSIGLMNQGAKNTESKISRWPWIFVTVAVSGLDLVATVTYANDSFHTRTLSDIMDFTGGIASGTGSIAVNTVWVAWAMVLLYSRFVILFFINLILIVLVVIDSNKKQDVGNDVVQVEAQTTAIASVGTNSEREDEISQLPDDIPTKILPRAGIRYSFRRMKSRLLNNDRQTPHDARSLPNSLGASPNRSPRLNKKDSDKERGVNFSQTNLPNRLEILIREQQKRLNKAVVDTTGRRSPPTGSQSMPHLPSSSWHDGLGRRGTAAELQGQLPWAYIPSGHPMRDHLPPDEDLPPVPLPDYNAIPSFRKASVHRAASSLSSLTQKKDYRTKAPRRKNNKYGKQGEIGISLQGKMKAILERNPDFETVIQYLEDKIDSESYWHDSIPIKLLKFAPLTSVDCERSFSAHKYILDLKRNNLRWKI